MAGVANSTRVWGLCRHDLKTFEKPAGPAQGEPAPTRAHPPATPLSPPLRHPQTCRALGSVTVQSPGPGPDPGPAPHTAVSRSPDPQEAGLGARRGAGQPSLSPGAQTGGRRGSGACGQARARAGARQSGCQGEGTQMWVEMVPRRERRGASRLPGCAGGSPRGWRLGTLLSVAPAILAGSRGTDVTRAS